MLACFTQDKSSLVPIITVRKCDYEAWHALQPANVVAWLLATQFRAEPGSFSLIQGSDCRIAFVLCILSDTENLWDVGQLPIALPEGHYQFESSTIPHAIGWGLGAYQFSRYKKPLRNPATLYLPDAIKKEVEDTVASLYLVRDLTNTPTDDMGPTELAKAASDLAKEFHADCKQIIGDDLLKQNYTSIYTVGRASDDAPRLVDITWGDAKHPKLTLVGKGVCFDTGGLDLKSSSNMLLMKKDMSGGAHVLGLARMIMAAKLPVRLRVLIPMVENAVSGNAYRPGDVIKSRKGLTIEVGNTDAEGRVILADALTEAVTENPDLLIDITTLTGAARVALGTELPAVFSNNDDVVHALIKVGDRILDPMWRMPLFAPYREQNNSQIADISNSGPEVYGGAITAALFLQAFVPDNIPWLHFDLMAWNLRAKPGRPQGAEAMAIRALFAYLRGRFI